MVNSAMQGEELSNPKTNDSLTLYGVFCATGPFVGMDFFSTVGRQACWFPSHCHGHDARSTRREAGQQDGDDRFESGTGWLPLAVCLPRPRPSP